MPQRQRRITISSRSAIAAPAGGAQLATQSLTTQRLADRTFGTLASQRSRSADQTFSVNRKYFIVSCICAQKQYLDFRSVILDLFKKQVLR